VRNWLRSPKLLKLFVGQHIVNGLSVAAGVAAVAAVGIAILGFNGGQLATLGAIGGSIGDFPAPLRVKARAMLTGFVLALAATTGIQLLDWSIPGEVLAIGVIAFVAGLVTGFGRWALTLSMQMLVPMVFVLGLPPLDIAGGMRAEAIFALGGFGYIAISLALTGLVAASDRRLMASECFRELAAYLRAIARFSEPETDIAEIYGGGIRQQAALSEQLQSARALLLTNPRASRERLRLAATIGVLLDVLDALVAAQSDMARLRAAPAAKTMLARMGVLYRAGALDIQHLSLDLLAHEKPRLPADHTLAHEALQREAARVVELEEIDAPTRVAVIATARRLASARNRILRLEKTLTDDATAEAAIGAVDLAAFQSQRTYHPRALKAHLALESPVFRFATRLSLAMMAGGLVATTLGGERHGNWVLLTIAVIMRASYGLTRQRRDDRLMGTLIGCVVASGAVAYAPIGLQVALQAFSLALTHSFARQNYRISSIGASMTALISLHLLEPAFHAPILARLTDTLIGAAIAHLFSFFWPTWEFVEAPRLARRLLARASGFASVALRADAPLHDYRMARKDLIEAVAALSDSAARMGGEPQNARRGLEEMTAMLIAASVFASHLSAARLDLRHPGGEAEALTQDDAERTRLWLLDRLATGADEASRLEPPNFEGPLSRLRAAALRLIEAARAYEQASQRE
jgi:uncharacterized membrane protein YccC